MTKKNSAFEDKWGKAIAGGGHTSIPNDLLELRIELKITEVQFLLIVCVLKFKWYSDNPYPAADTLSKLSGLAISTVRHNMQNLEEKGLIRRITRINSKTNARESNEYDFAPMRRTLEGYTQHLRRRTARYLKPDSTPYPAPDTKEEAANKTQEKRRSTNSGKVSLAGDVLKNKYPDIAIKR